MSLSVMTTHYLMCERNVEQWYLVIIPCSKKSLYLQWKRNCFWQTVSSGRKMLAKSELWYLNYACRILAIPGPDRTGFRLAANTAGVSSFFWSELRELVWWLKCAYACACLNVQWRGVHITPRGRKFRMQSWFHADPLSTFSFSNEFPWAHNSFS